MKARYQTTSISVPVGKKKNFCISSIEASSSSVISFPHIASHLIFLHQRKIRKRNPKHNLKPCRSKRKRRKHQTPRSPRKKKGKEKKKERGRDREEKTSHPLPQPPLHLPLHHPPLHLLIPRRRLPRRLPPLTPHALHRPNTPTPLLIPR